MHVEDRNTARWTGLATVLDGDAWPGIYDAEPIDLWDAWLFAAAESSLMLQAWTLAATEQRMGAYAGYRAALDREEQAALVLAGRLSTWAEAA